MLPNSEVDMTILLVWENVPEDTDLYTIEEDSEVAGWIDSCAGVYINACNTPEQDANIDRLSDWIEKQDKLPNGYLAIGPFSKVIVCGLIM